MGFSASLRLQTHLGTKFIASSNGAFHTDMIGATPAVTAPKTAMLFKFLYTPTPSSRTIMALHCLSKFAHTHSPENYGVYS